MLAGHRSTWLACLPIALLLAPLTGCISAGPTLDSYAEARQAPGTVIEPSGGEAPVHLKTLVPEEPSEVATGEVDVYFLLFDAEADRPVREAQVAIDVVASEDARPSSHVQPPTHVGEGVYHGVVTFDEPGGWELDLEVDPPGGDTLRYAVHVHAGEAHEH